MLFLWMAKARFISFGPCICLLRRDLQLFATNAGPEIDELTEVAKASSDTAIPIEVRTNDGKREEMFLDVDCLG